MQNNNTKKQTPNPNETQIRTEYCNTIWQIFRSIFWAILILFHRNFSIDWARLGQDQPIINLSLPIITRFLIHFCDNMAKNSANFFCI